MPGSASSRRERAVSLWPPCERAELEQKRANPGPITDEVAATSASAALCLFSLENSAAGRTRWQPAVVFLRHDLERVARIVQNSSGRANVPTAKSRSRACCDD